MSNLFSGNDFDEKHFWEDVLRKENTNQDLIDKRNLEADELAMEIARESRERAIQEHIRQNDGV